MIIAFISQIVEVAHRDIRQRKQAEQEQPKRKQDISVDVIWDDMKIGSIVSISSEWSSL